MIAAIYDDSGKLIRIEIRAQTEAEELNLQPARLAARDELPRQLTLNRKRKKEAA